MTLPTPRDLLTSLFTSLAAPSPALTPAHDAAPNPLRDVPAEKTALLSTLHVIFPSLLLPALDLLDRGLVTGVRVGNSPEGVSREPGAVRGEGTGTDEGARDGEAEGSGEPEESKGAGARAEGAEGAGGAERPEAAFYIVKSLASTMRKRGKEGQGRYYLVTLRAWNCTCPSFALDAFPPGPPTNLWAESEHSTRAGAGEEGRERGDGGQEAEGGQPTEGAQGAERGQGGDRSWSFGGASADGLGIGHHVPCCKHLLACVLSERWGAVLGSYVPVKTIQKGEVAGLVADV